MGLFGKKNKQVQQMAAQPLAPAQVPTGSYVESARLWGYQLRGAIQIGGDSEYGVYTYNSEPLKYISDGQVFEVEAYCGECVMVSGTGTRWDSASDGDVPILYGSQFIGFTSIPKDKVIEAAKYGYALKFKAVCKGMVPGYANVKNIKVLAPRPFYLYEWIKGMPDDRPLSHRENYFMEYVRNGECHRNLLPQSSWQFVDVSIQMIPTPCDSTAKPHIGVYTADGMQIMELSARSSGYKDMLTYMWKYSKYNVIAERMPTYGNEKPVYKVEILGFGEIDHGADW